MSLHAEGYTGVCDKCGRVAILPTKDEAYARKLLALLNWQSQDGKDYCEGCVPAMQAAGTLGPRQA